MSEIVWLSSETVLQNRPFTHPRHIPKDGNALRFMIDQISLVLANGVEGQFLHHFLPARDSWTQRLILTQPHKIGRLSSIVVVGFFGQARPNADWGLGAFFDDALLQEVPKYPDLLGYATFALCNQNYGNLVLFATETGKQRWSQGKTHAQAANEFSPTFYQSVRIYGGRLPTGIENSHQLILDQVKYFDFQAPPWRAIRRLAS